MCNKGKKCYNERSFPGKIISRYQHCNICNKCTKKHTHIHCRSCNKCLNLQLYNNHIKNCLYHHPSLVSRILIIKEIRRNTI